MYDFMTKLDIKKLDYEEDVYIIKLLSAQTNSFDKLEQPERAWHYIQASLCDETGKSSGLSVKDIEEKFTSEWVNALYLDIVEFNRTKKKLSSQEKKKSGTE